MIGGISTGGIASLWGAPINPQYTHIAREPPKPPKDLFCLGDWILLDLLPIYYKMAPVACWFCDIYLEKCAWIGHFSQNFTCSKLEFIILGGAKIVCPPKTNHTNPKISPKYPRDYLFRATKEFLEVRQLNLWCILSVVILHNNVATKKVDSMLILCKSCCIFV